MNLYFSRVRLRRAPDVGALARILLPDDADVRIAHGHRLIWSLFADAPHRERDFLWREDGGNAWQRTTFLILSRRPPEDRSNLFAIETKEFAPALAAGQRLRFRLRASPGASEPRPGARRGKRIDPLAQRLRGLSKEERGAVRHRAMQEVGAAWLVRQGARAGFGVAEEPNGEGRMRPLLQVDGDNWRTLCREGGRKPVGFSVLDFEGVLEVTDPATFLPALARGFGRAKAFGCGLMLLRPV